MKTLWFEIKARGGWTRKDEAALFLINAKSPGVLEQENSSLTAYLPASSEGIRPLKKRLKEIGWSFTSAPYIEKIDWTEDWKKWIKPVRVAGFLVKPAFSKARTRKGEILITIDPGMAFGTGGHPTTKMCLEAVAHIVKDRGIKDSLLDVGAGSGILSIAAKKLGVKDVTATDIDPVALKVARRNFRVNGVNVRLSKRPLLATGGVFTAVVANIQSDTLRSLSSALAEKVMPGGFLVLSGILKEEAEGIKSAYCNAGLKPYKTLSEKEWTTIIMTRQVWLSPPPIGERGIKR